jgi:integrase/recombinase XerD
MLNREIVNAWVGGLKARSPHTARSYREAVGRFLSETGKAVDQLTVTDALAYVGKLSESGLSRASIAHHISAVRSFLRHCQGLSLIPQTPLDALKRPTVAITSMGRYLDTSEAERLLASARRVSPQAHIAVAMMLGTGLRVAELASAQWRHLYRDPDGNLGLLVVGKGGRERVVAIRPDLWRLLEADRRRRGLSPELSAADTSPLVADARRTSASAMSVWRWVRAAADAAGIDKPLSPHWLRHTFGTLTAYGGANVFEIQQAMGHAQITTSQRYIHWGKGLADSAAHRLPISLS